MPTASREAKDLRGASADGEVAEVVPLRATPEDEPAEISMRVLRPPARWLNDFHGPEALERVARLAGIERSKIDSRDAWTSMERFERFLEGVYELAGDEKTFMDACSYKLAEGYGTFRFMLWAVTPTQVTRMAAKTMHLVCTFGRYEAMSEGSSLLRLRYFSTWAESRLACLSRQAQGLAQPTIWGLPKGRLIEKSCISRGDSCCEYELQNFSSTRGLPIVLGGIAGAVVGVIFGLLGIGVLPAWLAFVLLGGSLGYAYELRRANRANIQTATGFQEALVEIASDEAEVRTELLALQQRQTEWTRLMEEQVAERTSSLEKMVDQVRSLREDRETQLRGYSHDLRNPLAVIVAGLDSLDCFEDLSTKERKEIFDSLHESTARMEDLLDEMMESARLRTGLVREAPERIPTDDLVERYRRRIKALAHAKRLRTSVFSTREFPGHLTIDPLILDRVVDNLFTNAVKYTHRGSIVVELTGSPGTFTLKISDTGQGIEPEVIRSVFSPRAEGTVNRSSYGLGLSVVVKLLSQVGGKLEVMSMPDEGTTFWAHFPVDRPGIGAVNEPDREVGLDDVVTIRLREKE